MESFKTSGALQQPTAKQKQLFTAEAQLFSELKSIKEMPPKDGEK